MADLTTAPDVDYRRGTGFRIDRDRRLTSVVVDRRTAVALGAAGIALFVAVFVLDWIEAFPRGHWFHHWADYSALALLAGIAGIGIYRRVIVAGAERAVWEEAGWFRMRTSDRQTSHWGMERFDRVIIHRTNLLGFDTGAHGVNPRQPRTGIRFRVKLMGNSEVTVNSYRKREHAVALAYALSELTGYPVRDVC